MIKAVVYQRLLKDNDYDTSVFENSSIVEHRNGIVTIRTVDDQRQVFLRYICLSEGDQVYEGMRYAE